MMTPKWTEFIGLEPDPHHDSLIDKVLTAHRTSALENENVSSIALSLASSVNADFHHSVSSALLTLGKTHGPITMTREYIYGLGLEEIATAVRNGEIIPGWGNAFFKNDIDPAWVKVSEHIRLHNIDHWNKLNQITEVIENCKGKRLYPNASAFTAVTSHIVGLPLGLEMILTILGRLPAWGMQWQSQRNRN